jgi:hypothetical protein
MWRNGYFYFFFPLTLTVEADYSSRGVLPTMLASLCGTRKLVNEEVLAHWELSRLKQTNLDIKT